MNKQKRATIISKNHKYLNFGQTCSVIDFDVANKNYIVRADGEKGFRDVPYRQIFVHCDRNYPTLLKIKLDNLQETETEQRPIKVSAIKTIDRLRIYNDWRAGKIDKTMQEAKIEPSQVTKDINLVINFLKERAKYE